MILFDLSLPDGLRFSSVQNPYSVATSFPSFSAVPPASLSNILGKKVGGVRGGDPLFPEGTSVLTWEGLFSPGEVRVGSMGNYTGYFYFLFFIFYVLCFMFYVLCFMFYVLCFMFYFEIGLDLFIFFLILLSTIPLATTTTNRRSQRRSPPSFLEQLRICSLYCCCSFSF